MENPSAISSPVQLTPAATSSGDSTSVARNVPLDFIKGFLVLGMIVFHAVNYFALDLWPLLIYIKFVSGGFIFISGYVVSTFYAAKWAAAPRRTAIRLAIRGLKLVALFTIINLTISLLAVRNFNEVEFGFGQFTERAFDIYLLGSGKYAAFEILLPIGYLLLLSPVVLWLQRWRWLLLGILIVGSVAAFTMPARLNNFALLLVGAVGMLAGLFLSPERIASRTHLRTSVSALALAVLLLPWLRNSLAGYLLYLVGVLKCVADFSLVLPASWVARRIVLLLGEYVLFCYLAQIVILQAIFRLVWPHRESPVVAFLLITVVTGALTLLSVRIMVAARRWSPFVEKAYRFVFI